MQIDTKNLKKLKDSMFDCIVFIECFIDIKVLFSTNILYIYMYVSPPIFPPTVDKIFSMFERNDDDDDV